MGAIHKSIRLNKIERSDEQKLACEKIYNSSVTLLEGLPGTSKTFTAIYAGINLFKKGMVDRIIVTRPMVVAGKDPGHLPGGMSITGDDSKIAPYIKPIIETFEFMIGPQMTKKLIDEKILTVEPIVYLRGRNLRNAFVFVDETQNCTLTEFKLVATRICEGTHMAFAFDHNQIDLKDERQSAVWHVAALKHVKDVSHIELKENRRLAVSFAILEALEKSSEKKKEEKRKISPRKQEEYMPAEFHYYNREELIELADRMQIWNHPHNLTIT